MINSELNLAFRWYLNNNPNNSAKRAIEKQHYNRPQSGGNVFDLLTPNNTLLPFQFYMPSIDRALTTQSYDMVEWRIVRMDVKEPFGPGLLPGTFYDVRAELTLAGQPLANHFTKTAVADKGLYFFGCHLGNTFPFTIAKGYWYSAMRFADGTIAVSETFYVPCTNMDFDSFFGENGNLIRIDYWNEKDLYDIVYHTGFKNRIYLEADLINNEPRIVQEGEENAIGTFIPNLTQFIDVYTLTDWMPEYLFRAFQVMRAHNKITLWDRGYLHYSFLRLTDCSMDYSESLIDGMVTLQFEQADGMKVAAGCGQDYVPGTPIPLKANPDSIDVYPKIGPVGYNVMSNDEGISKVALPFVNSIFGTIKVSLSTTGALSVTQGGAITNLSYQKSYVIADGFGNTSASTLTIKITDWSTITHTINLSMVDYLFGQRSWSSPPLLNLLTGHHLPVNIKNLQCIAGLYFSGNGGNYLEVFADGTWTLHILSALSPGFAYESFPITYHNLSVPSNKSDLVVFQWI